MNRYGRRPQREYHQPSDDQDVFLKLLLAGALVCFLLLSGLFLFAGWHALRKPVAAGKETGNSSDRAAGDRSSVPKNNAAANVPVLAESKVGTTAPGVRRLADSNSPDPENVAPKYAWATNQKLVYEFKIKAELGSKEIRYRGRNTLEATGKIAKVTAEEQTQEGSGTGFVVHPDGVVVTCAHVVEGAKEITATLGGKTYDGSVIKLDTENDLAFVQLDAKGLPHLKVADSDQVRLGQDVRAIGYPLSDVLGKSIKVTKGEVSGRGGPAGINGLQIDATINPGNSGGPLVDNYGRLVGVTSSMLAGIGISEVGFAVPSNKVTELAKQLNVEIESGDIETGNTVPKLSAPDIVDLVRASTVLLEVTSGPGGVGMELPHELRFFCHWYQTSTPGMLGRIAHPGRHFNGVLQVNTSGKIIADDSQAPLPMLLGNAGGVGIETLPSSAPGRIVSNQIVILQTPKPSGRRPGFDPFGFGTPRRPPWARPKTQLPKDSGARIGHESVTMILGEPSHGSVTLTKKYSLTVDGESKDIKPLTITGSGEGRFDPVNGQMLEMKQEFTIIVQEKNVTVRIPVTMDYKQVDQETLAKEKQAAVQREIARAKKKAAGSSLSVKASTFDSPTQRSPSNEPQSKSFSVKDAPQSANLRKFNFKK
jgi:S1-C subfamily serine protease